MGKNVKIIAFVGLPGSGKSAAAQHLKNKGVPDVYFGGIIYKAMNEAGIEITPSSQEKFREEIRAREGTDFVVKRAVKQVQDLINAGQKRIILDGLYSWTEYRIIKHEFPGEVILVAMVPSKKVRHERMMRRAERPFTQEEVNQRDWSEIENLEKGGPIAIADYFIVNNGTLEETREQIDAIVDKIGFFE
jgi:Dephospho-CoA kinase